MENEPTRDCWIFVIRTNAYAGNFEREMCGFITGQVGECDVGAEDAKSFIKAHPGVVYDEFEDLVINFPDDHGCYRPVTVGYPSCNDVIIFLDNVPTEDQLILMRNRARQFAKITDPRDGKHKKITIRGFELISYIVERIEKLVSKWKARE